MATRLFVGRRVILAGGPSGAAGDEAAGAIYRRSKGPQPIYVPVDTYHYNDGMAGIQTRNWFLVPHLAAFAAMLGIVLLDRIVVDIPGWLTLAMVACSIVLTCLWAREAKRPDR